MKLSEWSMSILKTLFALAIGISINSACGAQSIVGKWHRTGTNSFKIDKTTGKETAVFTPEQQRQYDEKVAENAYEEVLEFKSDNTYTSTASAKGMKPKERTARYTLTGNSLDLNIPLVHNEKTMITIKSLAPRTMVWDLVFMDKLTRITYTRE